METMWSIFNTHQAAVIVIVAIALIIVYFLFKNLIKLALLFLLILILAGGYFYLTAPKKSPEDFTRAIKKTQEQTGQMIDKGKAAYEKGKDIIVKGKEITERVGKAIGGDNNGSSKE